MKNTSSEKVFPLETYSLQEHYGKETRLCLMETGFNKLMEEVREYDRVRIPDNVRYPVDKTYQKFLEQIVRQIEGYHRTKDADELKRSLELSLNLIHQMSDDITQTKLNNAHEVRKLKSRLSSFIQVKKDKEVSPDEDL